MLHQDGCVVIGTPVTRIIAINTDRPIVNSGCFVEQIQQIMQGIERTKRLAALCCW